MKQIYSSFRKFSGIAVLAPLCKLVEALLELTIPLFVAKIIDVGITNGDRSYIVTVALIMVAVGFVGLGFSLLGQFFAAKSAVGYAAEIREKLFQKTVNLPFSETDKIGVPRLLTSLTSDTNQLQTGVNLFLRLLLRSPFVVFGAWIMAITIDASLSIVFAVAVPLLFLVVFFVLLYTTPRYGKNQRALDDVTASTRETLTGTRVIRAFGEEERFHADYRKKTEALYRGQTLVARVSSLLNPFTYAIVNLAIIALLYFGGVKVNAGTLSQGQVVAVYQYMGQILVELIKLANLILLVSKSLAAGKRLSALLENTASQPQAQVGETSESEYLAFRSVSMRYGEGKNALTDITFSVLPGQTVGVIGGTGSGKSSLVALLARFYDASEGEIIYNGKPLNSYSVGEIRARIGFVMQKTELIQGTVADNLRMGNPSASDEELWNALTAAQIADTVREKGGLSAPVAQSGANFSGGQKQRLSIARALVKKPEILVLDDSASALDYATEARLRAAIKKLPYAPTVFIVSQRTASLSHADLILVLEHGAVIGVGKHSDLLSSCETYREIHHSQTGGEQHA